MTPGEKMFIAGCAIGWCSAVLCGGVVFAWIHRSRPAALDRSYQRAKGYES